MDASKKDVRGPGQDDGIGGSCPHPLPSKLFLI